MNSARRNQAFAGAVSAPYPVLGEEYVVHLFDRLAKEAFKHLPSLSVAREPFVTLGNRPEDFLRNLAQLMHTLPARGDPDQFFPVITRSIRSMSVKVEFIKMEDMVGLAKAIFDRIAGTEGDAMGLFTAATAA